MRNSWKVAKWEIKRNMQHKSFIISLFLTPAIFLVFFSVPMLLQAFESDPDPVQVYVTDELGVWNEEVEATLEDHFEWQMVEATEEGMVFQELEESENTIYIELTESALGGGQIPIYMSEDIDESMVHQFQGLEPPLRHHHFERLGLSEEEIELATHGIGLDPITVSAETEGTDGSGEEQEAGVDPFERLIPGAFAGLVLFSVVITGMMIFQSASQEKKDKVAEMILSSLTPTDLMQGKIIGYFVLGLVQVSVWLLFAIPVVQWRFEWPVLEYLFVPELLLLLFFAVAGYLLFASLFVGLGATVEDMTTSGNFQGMVFMIPWLPFILLGPVISNPEGTVAQIGSYFPLTSPGIMLIRLSMMDEWPWLEILISAVILLCSIWLLMKLAGKIFKTGILLYGKNATPKEIWKWLRY